MSKREAANGSGKEDRVAPMHETKPLLEGQRGNEPSEHGDAQCLLKMPNTKYKWGDSMFSARAYSSSGKRARKWRGRMPDFAFRGIKVRYP